MSNHLIELKQADIILKEAIESKLEDFDLVNCENPYCNGYDTVNSGTYYKLVNADDIKNEKCPECKKHTLQVYIELENREHFNTYSGFGYFVGTMPIIRPEIKQMIKPLFEARIKKTEKRFSNLWIHERSKLFQSIGIKDGDRLKDLCNTKFQEYDTNLKGIIATKLLNN